MAEFNKKLWIPIIVFVAIVVAIIVVVVIEYKKQWTCGSKLEPDTYWGPCQPGMSGSCSKCTDQNCACRNSNQANPCFRCLTLKDCQNASVEDGTTPYLNCSP